MSGPRRKGSDLFYEAMDSDKLQRLQSEHMAIWDEFKSHAEMRGVWRLALRMMVTEHRSFAEAAVFIGYRLPED
jgi:muconolactone delta-isomerase